MVFNSSFALPCVPPRNENRKEFAFGGRPLKQPLGRTGGRGKGDLGKTEMLKTETLEGRMLRRTPRSDGIGDFKAVFIQRAWDSGEVVHPRGWICRHSLPVVRRASRSCG
jgi:hypothetical protein